MDKSINERIQDLYHEFGAEYLSDESDENMAELVGRVYRSMYADSIPVEIPFTIETLMYAIVTIQYGSYTLQERRWLDLPNFVLCSNEQVLKQFHTDDPEELYKYGLRKIPQVDKATLVLEFLSGIDNEEISEMAKAMLTYNLSRRNIVALLLEKKSFQCGDRAHYISLWNDFSFRKLSKIAETWCIENHIPFIPPEPNKEDIQ